MRYALLGFAAVAFTLANRSGDATRKQLEFGFYPYYTVRNEGEALFQDETTLAARQHASFRPHVDTPSAMVR